MRNLLTRNNNWANLKAVGNQHRTPLTEALSETNRISTSLGADRFVRQLPLPRILIVPAQCYDLHASSLCAECREARLRGSAQVVGRCLGHSVGSKKSSVPPKVDLAPCPRTCMAPEVWRSGKCPALRRTHVRPAGSWLVTGSDPGPQTRRSVKALLESVSHPVVTSMLTLSDLSAAQRVPRAFFFTRLGMVVSPDVSPAFGLPIRYFGGCRDKAHQWIWASWGCHPGRHALPFTSPHFFPRRV